VVAVGHESFRASGAEGVRRLVKSQSVIYDIKGVLPREVADGRL